MSEGMPPIGEDDLQAYVDDRLEPSRRTAVEAYLAAAPDEARRIAAYRAQRQAMRQAFATAADEPLPRQLTLASIVSERRRPKPTPG
jgi:anti-sigma factor RsiW